MDFAENNKGLLMKYQETRDNDFVEKLYIMNQGLFWVICKRLSFLMEMSDLMQECYFALLVAIDGYNESKGEFSAYLAKVTSSYLLRTARKNSGVYIPEYMQTQINKYLSLQTENKKTDQELCYLLEVDQEQLTEIRKALQVKNIGSLDEPLTTDDKFCKYDLVADQENDFTESVIDKIYNTELAKAIKEALEELPEDKRLLIELRFYQNMTYSEINPETSGECTRLKIDNICRKLRKNKKLKSFYDENNIYKCTGVTYFKNNQQSSIERFVVKKLLLEQQEDEEM